MTAFKIVSSPFLVAPHAGVSPGPRGSLRASQNEGYISQGVEQLFIKRWWI